MNATTGEDEMAGELNQISQEIGKLQAHSETQTNDIGELRKIASDIYDCVRAVQSDHGERLVALEACRDTVFKDIKPAVQQQSKDLHALSTNLTNSKWKGLLLATGMVGTGGGAGAVVHKLIEKMGWFS